MRALVLSLLLPTVSFAGQPSHDIVPEDFFSLDTVGAITVSRTGSRAVYVRRRWDQANDRQRSDLWMLDTRARTSTRLTHFDEDATSPTLSPDDDWVYFLSKDPQSTPQVYRIRASGEGIQQLTRTPDGVDSYDLAGDGRSLWYATSEEVHTDNPWDGLRDEFAGARYPAGKVQQTHLRRLDLQSWRDVHEHSPGAYLIDFDVTEDESRVALMTAPDDDLVTHEGWSAVHILVRDTGEVVALPDSLWRREAPSPYGWLLGLEWSSDGRALAFRVDFDGYPGETFVAELAGGDPLVWRLPRPRELTPVGASMRWVPGKRELCLLGAEQARTKISCRSGLRGGGVGKERSFPEGNVVIDAFALSRDGRDIIASAATPAKFEELYRLPARGQLMPVQLTNLNEHTADWKLPAVDLVRWTTPDGVDVEGILETPPGWVPGDGPLPMLVQLHGGPTSHTPFSRRFRIYGQTAFAAKGWALLSPNYRGSTSYGDTFITDLVGRENQVEVSDILAGVDAMVDRGIADPDHLAIMGWSNGGYLTNALIATTDRFAAASSGAGVFDMAMQWMLEDTPGHVVNFLEGHPWERAQQMRDASPLYSVHKVHTPTLIHVGELDARVPAAHSRGLYRALSTYLDVPSELVIYPGAGHSLRTWTHRATKLAWDHAWMEHYVLSDEEEASDAAASTP